MTKKRALLAVAVASIIGVVAYRRKGSKDAPASPKPDEVQEWGEESFPASDPPSHW